MSLHRPLSLLLLLTTSGVALAQEAAPGDRTEVLSSEADTIIRNAEVIKTIQTKDFLKSGRFEFGLYAGGVTNDPFLRRWVGGGSATYHITEILSLEVAGSYSPDLGAADNRQLTNQIRTTYAASPTIAKVNAAGSVDLVFSPLYGKIAFNRQQIVNFDIFLAAGVGVSRTKDSSDTTEGDVPLTQQEADALIETHATTNFGFGFRGAFNEWMALRVDGRSYQYIEHTVAHAEGTPEESLEMKSNFVAQVGLSFFVPTTWKKR